MGFRKKVLQAIYAVFTSVYIIWQFYCKTEISNLYPKDHVVFTIKLQSTVPSYYKGFQLLWAFRFNQSHHVLYCKKVLWTRNVDVAGNRWPGSGRPRRRERGKYLFYCLSKSALPTRTEVGQSTFSRGKYKWLV